MATLFPTGIDSLGDPTSANRLSDPLPKHSALHSTLSDALTVIEGLFVAPANTAIRNIAKFGAKLDGVTNDSPAVNAAIADLPARGGIVFHPGGLCYCATNVNILQGNTHFVGVGPSTSQYKFGATASIIGNLVSAVYFSFRNLSIYGQGTTPAALVQLTGCYVIDTVNANFADAAILLQLNQCGHIHISPTTTFNFNSASNQKAIQLSGCVDGQVFGTFEGQTGGTMDFIVFAGACDTIAVKIASRSEHNRVVRFLNSSACLNLSIEGCVDRESKVSFVSVDNGGVVTDSIIAGNTSNGTGSGTIAYDFSNTGCGVGLTVVNNRANNYAAAPVNMVGATGHLDHWGSGSPETVIAAPLGSLWHRTDGGAGTSLYVKETGAGNTGWVGK